MALGIKDGEKKRQGERSAASVEQAMNPGYRGRPVMVTMGPRVGIVATASYEVREYGIKTGMPVNEAYKLCPGGIFVNARLALYVHISKEILKIYQKHLRALPMLVVIPRDSF